MHRRYPGCATVAFGGFAMPGTLFHLIRALAEHGAKQPHLYREHYRRGAAATHARYRADCSNRVRCGRRPRLHGGDPGLGRAVVHPLLRIRTRRRPNWCRKARRPNGCARPALAFQPSTCRPPGNRTGGGAGDPRVQRPRIPAGICPPVDYAFLRAPPGRCVRQPAVPSFPTQLQPGDGDGGPVSRWWRWMRTSCRSARSTPTRDTPRHLHPSFGEDPPPPDGIWPIRRQERRR